MERYVCVHGHFYQPPRENPWLESVEFQDSAYPYHDWNERIAAECYAPNGLARILDGDGRIVEITNNYCKMSFNFGPTLLSWMASATPRTYELIIEADRQSRHQHRGHGAALAQPYNHVIMPLANRRDKLTQLLWGVRDFEYRFGRRPEGMWLPETAVDLATLDMMASVGIRFSIFSPHQALRMRSLEGDANWIDVSAGQIDPKRPYLVRLPSRRSLVAFFYDGPISRAVAFERLLERGENLADRLVQAFDPAEPGPQLVNIASDGETFGHHHRYGEMALAYALKLLEEQSLAHLTNYGEYLELFPPTHEVELVEESSWSCVHGVERWRSDCGCNSGGHPEWNQSWRAPLRQTFDWLRDRVTNLYEREGSRLLKQPWNARQDYINILLDRSPSVREEFFRQHARTRLTGPEVSEALKLLELQRHALLMYTSCGWFFDELSGLEGVQVIQYAARVVQLAADFGLELEDELRERLGRAKSNLGDVGDGRAVYDRFARPAMVDLHKVAAAYALISLCESQAERAHLHCYTVRSMDEALVTSGKSRLATGRVEVASDVTLETGQFVFAAVHVGEHNLSAGVRESLGGGGLAGAAVDVSPVFARGDVTELIRALDREFEGRTYSLSSLFRDDQRRILKTILDGDLKETEAVYRQIYQAHAALMRFVTSIGIRAPRRLELAAEVTLNADLERQLSSDDIDTGQVSALMEEAKAVGAPLDRPKLELALRRTFERLAEDMLRAPVSLPRIAKMERAARLARSMQFETTLWPVQNAYYQVAKSIYPAVRDAAAQEDREAAEWARRFAALGQILLLATIP